MLSIAELPRYETYKDSGVEWLGKIPKSWDQSRLKLLVSIKTGEKDTVHRVDDGKYPFFIRSPKVQNIDTYSFDGEAILTAGDGDIGKIFHYIKGKFDYHQRVYKFSDFKKVEGKYLYYYLQYNLAEEVVKLSAKTTVDSLRLPYLQNFVVAIPGSQEQKWIYRFLDRKTTQIDEAIAIKEQQIALLKERKQIIIQKAVTQGLDPNVPMKDSGVEWIGEIPAHWEVVKFKYLANVRYGLGQPPKTLDGGLKIIRATNVERGKIVEKSMLYVDPSDIPWDRNPELREGEIIVVRSGAYTGDSALVTKEYDGAIAGYDMVATPLNCCPAFLGNALLSKYVLFDQIYLLRMRSAQPHLNAEELNELLIAVPPENEQEKIVGYLNYIDFEFERSLKIFIDQIEKLKEYKTTLINSAVTGKIRITPDMVEA